MDGEPGEVRRNERKKNISIDSDSWNTGMNELHEMKIEKNETRKEERKANQRKRCRWENNVKNME